MGAVGICARSTKELSSEVYNMAAVAGTKGKVCLHQLNENSLQVDLIKGLLGKSITLRQASILLAENAKIREIGVDTNMVCNLNCTYCYLSDRPEQKGTSRLDLLESYLADQIKNGVKLVAFIGKEPLADQRATALMTSLNKLKTKYSFRTGMVTNGTLIEKHVESIVNADPAYLDISIDGNQDTNDKLRGKGTYHKALEGIKIILGTHLKPALSTTTVLWHDSKDGFLAHVNNMFNMGVETCFGSPVLNFAIGNNNQHIAIDLNSIEKVINLLSKEFRVINSTEKQVMIDLPYRYTWEILQSGMIPVNQLKEDRFEAIFWHIPGTAVVIKLNPFSFSYFRAFRVTHDGTIIHNMDLAAHQQYSEGTLNIEREKENKLAPNVFKAISERFHQSFLESHLIAEHEIQVFERYLEKQHRDNLELLNCC